MTDDRSTQGTDAPVSASGRRPPSLVVGIGASAGGLAAFRSFFDNMPADTGLAFVLVQHLDPDHKSLLAELLRPHTGMEVLEAKDRAALVPNQIHVIPPNATLTLDGDVLRVGRGCRRWPNPTRYLSIRTGRAYPWTN
jgi:two-component system, chemotaxis family, CheB/CheR fusion protein